MNEGTFFAGVGALALAAGLGFMSYYTVDQGERGVIIRNGAVIGVAEPGLGFKNPLMSKVRDIDVRTNARQYKEVLAYSRDQQTASLLLSVTYHLPADQVVEIYSEFGGEEGVLSRVLDRQVMQEAKNVFGRFNAATAIQDRARLVAETEAAIIAAVDGPIIIESVQIENIDFSDAYEQSVEQRMLAEVEVAKVAQNAEREKVQAEIRVIQAQADADARLAQAKADAEAVRLAGEAEADAIRAKGDALRANPQLVALVTAENWNGVLPATMLPGGTVPFIEVGQ